ncbi:MAG TPA: biotin/lipoyl-containing protein [Bacteroidota bacterium]|nr:biotin/lipoyl-containing protein [Bacteroidota bacterium]
MTELIATVGGEDYIWNFGEDGRITCNGRPVEVDVRRISTNRVSVVLSGRSFDATVAKVESAYEVRLKGDLFRVEVESAEKRGARTNATPNARVGAEVKAPMPGLVVRLEVSEGETVNAGDGLLILEAMKMENEIRSRVQGTVARILIKEKQTVDKGQLLLVIQ